MRPNFASLFVTFLCACILSSPCRPQGAPTAREDDKTLRVFIFAGQSNMVGSHSNAKDVASFPPFIGCGNEQSKIRYSYAIGRESMRKSTGWTTLQPVNNVVGPELSFGKIVSDSIKAPIAIIKCASGGTTLGKDWRPDDPDGFKLYPLALQLVQESLRELDKKKIKYRIEGFMWHQGENDMFDNEFKVAYAANLKKFIASWRRDLGVHDLPFYIGELSCKTVWGMDNRSNMYAISLAQKQVCEEDAQVEYIPTNHVGVRTQSENGLHYHYGTLGQLEHGANYAAAYLLNIGKLEKDERPLNKWPFRESGTVKLFVLAGHRNMEGEVSFLEHLKKTRYSNLRKDNHKIPYRYSLGGGFKKAEEWQPLGPAGMYGTFGPELSFGSNLQKKIKGNIAIIKFTHSGSQIIDWTPEGSNAKLRNLYPTFITFIKEQIASLEEKGHKVELQGIFYHLGENDMSFGEYKSQASSRISRLVSQSRLDLGAPTLSWFVSQQPPTQFNTAPQGNVSEQLEDWASSNISNFHLRAKDMITKDEKILMNSEGIVKLGLLLSNAYIKSQ